MSALSYAKNICYSVWKHFRLQNKSLSTQFSQIEKVRFYCRLPFLFIIILGHGFCRYFILPKQYDI